MRRDQLEVEVRDSDWVDTAEAPVEPTLSITHHGPVSALRDRLIGPGDVLITTDELDVAFRYLSNPTEADAAGVLSVTNRTTGAYLLELSAEPTQIHSLTEAAKQYAKETDTERRYSLQLWTSRSQFASYHKRIVLVYGPDGTLLRHHSLIPAGIEI